MEHFITTKLALSEKMASATRHNLQQCSGIGKGLHLIIAPGDPGDWVGPQMGQASRVQWAVRTGATQVLEMVNGARGPGMPQQCHLVTINRQAGPLARSQQAGGALESLKSLDHEHDCDLDHLWCWCLVGIGGGDDD
jgi:hypothetical protein